MKTLKELLWFIVPTVIIGVLLYIFTFVVTANLPGFIGPQNYLRLFMNDPVFLKALINTVSLPLLLAGGIGVVLFLIKHFLFKDQQRGIFYAVYFISTSALLIQPNIPAILLSMQFGVIICFIFWCAEKIIQKMKTKKVG